MNNLYHEYLHQSFGQFFAIERILYESKTEHQHLLIFENPRFGRVMALDGIIQTTERDEFFYHEMLVHVPLFAHGSTRRVLIIGGGDGGSLREALRHPGLERATLVEIDAGVIDLCKQYLPAHSQGAFDDPRAEIVIADGMGFVRDAKPGQFDIIICDSTDPVGPGAVLFSEAFYAACKTALAPGGIIVTQNGVAFLQLDEVKNTWQRLGRQFSDCTFYAAAVPTYAGGIMAFGWGSDNSAARSVSLAVLKQRFAASAMTTRYYNPDIHAGAFALPQYVLDALD